MVVYVKYDRCKPKLPVAIADSDVELAAMTGTTVDVVRSSISHGRETYQRIEIDLDLEDV